MEWDWNPSLLSLTLDYFPWTLCQEGKKVVGWVRRREETAYLLYFTSSAPVLLRGSHEDMPRRPPATCGRPQLLH